MDSKPKTKKKNENPRIRAFPMTMDAEYVASTLATLRTACEAVLKKCDCGCFEDLYRNAYTLVLHGHGERLYNDLKEVLAHHLESKVPEILESKDKIFLEVLNEVWQNYQASVAQIRDFLMYVERVYLVPERGSNIFDLSFTGFRDQIVRHDGIRDRLRNELLDAVKRERRGEVVDRLAIKNACEILMIVGIGDRALYEEVFESPFLNQTAEFYMIESQRLLAENSASDYRRKAKSQMNEEIERAEVCFNETTLSKLAGVVENELFTKHNISLSTARRKNTSGIRIEASETAGQKPVEQSNGFLC